MVKGGSVMVVVRDVTTWFVTTRMDSSHHPVVEVFAVSMSGMCTYVSFGTASGPFQLKLQSQNIHDLSGEFGREERLRAKGFLLPTSKMALTLVESASVSGRVISVPSLTAGVIPKE
ncbi:hypothetical protein TREMEDRAFT_65079 [Tremella mesenterica DSM 1558]|uniref:uncharacterized protein n=1 Tax=Tremella mesenterica (strain ATCC 24925 / CBS 8224 / DSM 1558 / NBRC 9311 / NRRL Y-6157 / RJB 2259-6 / UBC 559-6) TaxID=578456 RepID=UPI00032CE78A|nr:uncharacterized protein TREMEDRAFT_65079 [Tremella mesenterica DSM 1558]EIW66687.1 hypothetical protein TREMEDRAFT_65079 [Tremella mesenterica DSM 1558]